MEEANQQVNYVDKLNRVNMTYKSKMKPTKLAVVSVLALIIIVFAYLTAIGTWNPINGFQTTTSTPTPIPSNTWTPTPIPSTTGTPTPNQTQTPPPNPLGTNDTYPTPSPTSSPTGLSGDSVGISLHSLNSSDAQLVVDSGAKWIRLDVDNNFNSAVTIAHAKGLKVLGILGSWMFPYKSTNIGLTDWQSKVTSYVTQNPSVEAWEIWNEPANPTYPLLNLNITAPNSQSNLTTIAQFYYNMCQTAKPIIRQYNANATIVLMGGLNLYSNTDPHLALDEQFAQLTANMGISQYGDAISIHAYPWGATQPTQSVWDSYTNTLNYYRLTFPNMPIWVTETGQQLKLNSTKQIDVNNEDIPAQYLVKATRLFQTQPNVTHMFWYSLWDNQWEVNQTNPQYFGLLNSDGTHRPAFNQLQSLYR